MSGGFETIPGTLTSVIGSLSTVEGQRFQHAAYKAILDAYDGDRDAAWKDSVNEEKVDYISAIVKEGVRFYTVSSMPLPRKAIEDFHWHGSLIPKGTMILISTSKPSFVNIRRSSCKPRGSALRSRCPSLQPRTLAQYSSIKRDFDSPLRIRGGE